ncbi:MAG: TIGR02452 family protein [Lachnospiraceae bacterium]|nr:TIGR02452 family protein [Lachnospiraceae bacterium]
MSREENVEVFDDTMYLCETEKKLIDAIENSVAAQQFYKEGEEIAGALLKREKPAKVFVSKKRSFEAARAYYGKKVLVHNFASASNPGGGVVRGASAQEEALCRISTLYPCLNVREMWEKFYRPHRLMMDPLHNDDCIYTPGVLVIKTDTTYPQLMPTQAWYEADVLTCAAPNLRERPTNPFNPEDGSVKVEISDDDLYALHVKRFRRMLEIAAKNGVDVVILGAFGCGAFKNSPKVVARAAKQVVEEYKEYFETVEFAVYCSRWDTENYKVFAETFAS